MAHRQIVLDTETTGIDPKQGHRIIEIGCVELVNRRLTGNNFHVYINPQREIEEEAIDVHGITNEFLRDKPLYHQIAHELIIGKSAAGKPRLKNQLRMSIYGNDSMRPANNTA